MSPLRPNTYSDEIDFRERRIVGRFVVPDTVHTLLENLYSVVGQFRPPSNADTVQLSVIGICSNELQARLPKCVVKLVTNLR